MRVCIVSIFDNTNYGNRLQNYALQQVLLRYSQKVLTIKNKAFYSGKSRLLRMLPLAESVICNKLLGMDRRAAFVEFTRKYLTLSKKCYWNDRADSRIKQCDSCDMYCAGSDQIWNPGYDKGGDFIYLGFAERDCTFSYAASFGVDTIPEQHREEIRKGLEHIKYISVREEAGRKIVKDLTGREDVWVLADPTLLLDCADWDRVAVRPEATVPQKYVLTYFLGEVSPQRRRSICDRAKEMGCELIELMDKESPFYNMGPGEFVYLIKHADLVCTDSFHGSIFSFLYCRPMAIFARKGSNQDMSSRIDTLAAKFNLGSCVVRGDELPEVLPQADYAAGMSALGQEREKAKEFLDMVFEEAQRKGLCR